MEHIRFDVKDRQDEEGKVIVGRHKDLFARVPGVIIDRTIGVHAGRAHLRPNEDSLIGTDGDTQILILALCKAFVGVKTNDHPSGFIFDGGKPCILDFLYFTLSIAWGAIVIIIRAERWVISTGRGITDPEAGGIFDDQPGIE